MQATQSRTASGMGRRGEQAVAPPYININRYRDSDETPRRRWTDWSDGGAEDPESLSVEAGELLSVLHLSATMLGQPGLCEADRDSIRGELDELVNRSWTLLEHLVESKAKGEPDAVTFARPLFLQSQIVNGSSVGSEPLDSEARRGLLTEVHAEAGGAERGVVLERTAAGWIAC